MTSFQFPRHRKFKRLVILSEYSMAQPSKPGVHSGEVCIFKLPFLFNFYFLKFSSLFTTRNQTVCSDFLTENAASYRASSSVAQKGSNKNKERFVDDADLVRRSDRKRRKVYETLNVKMLTDHRYLTGFENSKSPKKKGERKRYLVEEESDSQTEGDEVKFKYCVVLFEIGANFSFLAPIA